MHNLKYHTFACSGCEVSKPSNLSSRKGCDVGCLLPGVGGAVCLTQHTRLRPFTACTIICMQWDEPIHNVVVNNLSSSVRVPSVPYPPQPKNKVGRCLCAHWSLPSGIEQVNLHELSEANPSDQLWCRLARGPGRQLLSRPGQLEHFISCPVVVSLRVFCSHLHGGWFSHVACFLTARVE